MPRRGPVALASLALVAGCAGGMEGRWVGRVVPEPGSLPAPGCRGEGRGVLTVRSGEAVFTPDDGTVVLRGRAEPDGAIRASLSRPGADRRPYVLRFDGKSDAGEVSGTYAAPGCRAAVLLRPA